MMINAAINPSKKGMVPVERIFQICQTLKPPMFSERTRICKPESNIGCEKSNTCSRCEVIEIAAIAFTSFHTCQYFFDVGFLNKMRCGFDLAGNCLSQLDRKTLIFIVVLQYKRRDHAGDNFKIGEINGCGRCRVSNLRKTRNSKACPKNDQAKSHNLKNTRHLASPIFYCSIPSRGAN